MHETELLGSVTPGLEGAPRSQMHSNRRGAAPVAAVPVFQPENGKEGGVDAVCGIESTQ